MKDLSLSSNNTFIIEDSKTGLVSALGSGARVIAITTSLSREQIKNIDGNIFIAESYVDIGDYLQNC